MTDRNAHVKSFSRRLAAWIDCHPRTGWYIAIWAALVSINALFGLLDLMLRVVS